MEAVVTIKFYTNDKPLVFRGEECYVVDDLIIEACKCLEIGPLPRHLFGLYSTVYKIWLPLCSELSAGGNAWNLYFRLRYRLPSIKRLIEKGDGKTFNYYYHQVRTDFLEGRIPDVLKSRESALGFVATDIIQLMLEKKLTPETMKYNCRDFFPQELKRSSIFDSFLQVPLEKAVNKGWLNSRQNSEFVKEKYLEQMFDLAPDYGCETYNVRVEENGIFYEVVAVVNPFHPSFPGIRIKIPGRKDVWTHICSIEDLCYISIREDKKKIKGEKRVVLNYCLEICRKTGIPHYFKFQSVPEMHSFVSVLDGYYRLMEKWTYNLCANLPSPTLLKLKSMKCHGPTGRDFAYNKLEEKSKNETGCYILRESEVEYDEYFVDVCIERSSNQKENIHSYKITISDDDLYCLQGWSNKFSTIHDLLAFHTTTSNLNFKRCIPSSEYDVSDLMLCRKSDRDNNLVTRGDCNCDAQCIPHDAIAFSKNTLNGRFTTVSLGHLRRSCRESKPVAIKSLRADTKTMYLEEFLSQVDKVLFWQHEYIVSTVGTVLKPFSLVMEYLPYGPLDQYLIKQCKKLPEVDLVEAAYYIARALWYLEEQKTVHGNIRCHNILVANHTDSSLKVKLADPGIISYTDSDIHWIPPECYDDYSLASKSKSADVYAYGTTLWEMFSFGAKPLSEKSSKEAKMFYKKGYMLPSPEHGHPDIKQLMKDCWAVDQDSRKRPQSIVRDVNQVLYVVYNSRRKYEYATISETSSFSSEKINLVEKEVELPPVPERRQPKEQTLSKKLNSFANMFKKQITNPNKDVAYDTLSQITVQTSINGSSGHSSCALISNDQFDECIMQPVGESDNLSDSSNSVTNDDDDKFDPRWLINIEELMFDSHLGQGFYGSVQKATFNRGTAREVAVKRILSITTGDPNPTQEQVQEEDLKREIRILTALNHRNIVSIIGIVAVPHVMLVMEYIENGNLLDYIQKHIPKLSHGQLTVFAIEIAEGMHYLERKNIVHRDLATRNVLVVSKDHVKISDFGLAQNMNGSNYYILRTYRHLPVRWYAVESILHGKFTHKSDVWSFGVCLWELFTHGQVPLVKTADGSVIDDLHLGLHLDQGKRLKYPNSCPVEVYNLMKHCWDADPHLRPSFSEMIITLETLNQELFCNDFDENGFLNPIK